MGASRELHHRGTSAAAHPDPRRPARSAVGAGASGRRGPGGGADGAGHVRRRSRLRLLQRRQLRSGAHLPRRAPGDTAPLLASRPIVVAARPRRVGLRLQDPARHRHGDRARRPRSGLGARQHRRRERAASAPGDERRAGPVADAARVQPAAAGRCAVFAARPPGRRRRRRLRRRGGRLPPAARDERRGAHPPRRDGALARPRRRLRRRERGLSPQRPRLPHEHRSGGARRLREVRGQRSRAARLPGRARSTPATSPRASAPA